MTKKSIKEMGVGGIAGFQVPIGIKKRKKKVDEMIELNDLKLSEVIAYFSGLNEDDSKAVESMLDEADYVKLSEMIRQGYAESALRQMIRTKVKEVVRKNDSGGYTLYAPNPGKGKASKRVADFTTKAAARRAELHRFPPKDPDKLKRMRKELEKIAKDPAKAARAELQAKKKSKKESIDRLAKAISESIFREEKKPSEWDEYISKLSKSAVLSDKKFQKFQKDIQKKSEKVLSDAKGSLKKVLSAENFELKKQDVKKDTEHGLLRLEFSVGDTQGTAEVGMFHVVIKDGYPKIEIDASVRSGMTKLDPERSKLLRSELMSAQEDIFDKVEDVRKIMDKRDEYLIKLEKKIDDFVADLNALEITMLKNVLVQKYRKI